MTRSPRQLPLGGRLVALTIAVAALAVLVGLGSSAPDGLGLQACSYRASHGYDCPTCGYTRAATLAAHGHIVSAMAMQPAAGLATLVMAMTVWVAGFAAFTGSRVVLRLRALWRPMTFVVLAAVFLAAWGYRLLAWR